MKINRDAIQQFFSQTVPEAGKAAKSRFVNAWKNAVENRQQKATDRKIHAALLQKENWMVGGVAEKYSAPIKLLTERVRTLAASSSEERAKNMLSTNEVCLLLCCWQRFHRDGYDLNKCPDAVKELLDALIAGGLLQGKNAADGYRPWLPHDQIGDLRAITTYIQDLQNPPSKKLIESHFVGNTAHLAIPSYLLDVLSPLVLIPRSSIPPLEVHEDDVKLLQALTPSSLLILMMLETFLLSSTPLQH